MKRDVADFWNLLWEVALGLAACFALLNAYAPHQDLPWKPLDLNQPIGAATEGKVADFEIQRLASAEEIKAVTDACMTKLRQAGVQVERAQDRDDGGFCIVRGAVRITGGDVTPLAPSNIVMQCPMAMRYVIWDRQVLRPAAQRVFGTEVKSVQNYGSYSCRRIYGQTSPDARPSEHARANALDVAGVTLEDGRAITVANDWNGTGRTGSDGAVFLKALRAGACRAFSTVLSPDYNEAHGDHLHLDAASRGLCA